MKKLFFILPIFVLIGFFSIFALSSPTMRPTAKSLPDFTLVVSGQEIGYLSPCGCAEGQIGGFPRRDSALRQLTRGGKNLLRLANGNLISDAGRQSELKAEIVFTALKEMEYAAFNVGPRDLLLGIEQLKYLSKTSEILFCQRICLKMKHVYFSLTYLLLCNPSIFKEKWESLGLFPNNLKYMLKTQIRI